MFRKVGEIYTENSKDDDKILKAINDSGYVACWIEEFGDGNHWLFMEILPEKEFIKQ